MAYHDSRHVRLSAIHAAGADIGSIELAELKAASACTYLCARAVGHGKGADCLHG